MQSELVFRKIETSVTNKSLGLLCRDFENGLIEFLEVRNYPFDAIAGEPVVVSSEVSETTDPMSFVEEAALRFIAKQA